LLFLQQHLRVPNYEYGALGDFNIYLHANNTPTRIFMHYLQGPPCEFNTNKRDWPNPRDFSKIPSILNQKHVAKHDSKLCYGWQKNKLWWWKERSPFLLGTFQCGHPWKAPKRGVGLMERGVHHKRIQFFLHQMVTMVQGTYNV
jgi:hypothetical protein